MSDIGFATNLNVERKPPANAGEILRRIFEYRSFPAGPGECLLKIMEIINAGKLERDFRRWLDERGAYDRRFAEVMFQTICLGSYRSGPVGCNFGPGPERWLLSGGTIYCTEHRILDGLIRQANDPIWNDIFPPNGWCCGCQVIIAERGDKSKRITVTNDLRYACRNWIDTDLEEYVRRHW